MESFDIERLLDQTEDDLYANIGRSQVRRGGLAVAPRSDEELVDDGKEWFAQQRTAIAERICGSHTVRVYLESDRVMNRIIIVASIADLISSIATGISGLSVAVLIIKEGLETLCSPKL